MWKEFQTWMAKDPKNKQIVTNTLIGGGAGGLLSLANAINANQYRDPEDRTSVIGQGLMGALMGATAGGAGTYAWQRLGPKGKGKGEGERREPTTTENLRDAGFSTLGAVGRNTGKLLGGTAGGIGTIQQLQELGIRNDKIKDVAEGILTKSRQSPGSVGLPRPQDLTQLEGLVQKYNAQKVKGKQKRELAKQMRKLLHSNADIKALRNPFLTRRTVGNIAAPFLGWGVDKCR